MTQVQLKQIAKSYSGTIALSECDLSIQSGELVALLGPSGCGKTTTLRMIAGLETPTSGQILFDGKEVSDVAVQSRNVGLVFQRYALFPHMTVEKNIAFGLKVRGQTAAQITEAVDEMLDVVQLRAFRDRFPAQLSGGQMQRVAIARTLITEPDVLMMDEPLANLDTKLRGEMRRFIRQLQRRLGITTIFVTHDQVEAMELADRVAVMAEGRILQFDPPDTLYQRPKTPAVAKFMGATNLFPATLKRDGLAECALGTLHYDPAVGAVEGQGHILLRAEAFDLHLTPPADSENTFTAKILTREYFGAATRYTLLCNDVQLTVQEHSRRRIEEGTLAYLTIKPEHIWVLQPS
ncbi:putative spermidine/putrescine transport system ATP-binding protein [Epibacterium ulvae]|uniref:Putative spermidine/putrescine transport system ATP-binding protein n=1 Tax=Epibacterium ulvae TaxID=1156985 RepID=A0A1G5RBX2_9RHOB|nr:ABC transporter ATP-binding protein [Epibacterium ulvae]SCZ70901.1 putative spermidine/putrescine transport system ATP-binding protein [Epibacterium ulvae]